MKHKRLVMSGAVGGLVIGGVLTAAWASQPYTSRAVLRASASQIPEQLVPAQSRLELDQVVPRLAQTVTSRGNLMNVVKMYNLYPEEHDRKPMEEIVDHMGQALRISSLSGTAFEVSFTYPDRVLAQKVTRDIVNRILSGYTRERTTLALLTVQFVKDTADAAGKDWEQKLARVRAVQSSRNATERLMLDAEIARQRYETLSHKLADAEMIHALETRQQGPNIEVVDAPTLPAESRLSVVLAALLGSTAGALIGFFVSAVFSQRSGTPAVQY